LPAINEPVPDIGLETDFSTLPPPSGPLDNFSFSSYSTSWDQNSSFQVPFLSELGTKNAEEYTMVPRPDNLSSRRPSRICPDIFIHDPLLRGLTKRLLEESWYLDGAPERQISEKEARLGIGLVGKSIFLAYARTIPDSATRTRWRCLICEASDGTTNQTNPKYAYGREERILKHIRHHFVHRPWVCGGQCGTAEW